MIQTDSGNISGDISPHMDDERDNSISEFLEKYLEKRELQQNRAYDLGLLLLLPTAVTRTISPYSRLSRFKILSIVIAFNRGRKAVYKYLFQWDVCECQEMYNSDKQNLSD